MKNAIKGVLLLCFAAVTYGFYSWLDDIKNNAPVPEYVPTEQATSNEKGGLKPYPNKWNIDSILKHFNNYDIEIKQESDTVFRVIGREYVENTKLDITFDPISKEFYSAHLHYIDNTRQYVEEKDLKMMFNFYRAFDKRFENYFRKNFEDLFHTRDSKSDNKCTFDGVIGEVFDDYFTDYMNDRDVRIESGCINIENSRWGRRQKGIK